MKKSNFALLLAVVLLSGCAQVTGYHPVVDSYGDPNAMNLQRDMQECERLAGQAASTGKETLLGAGVGALAGGAGGAALGALTGGGAGIGAAVGAVGAGLAGGGYQAYQADSAYKNTYNNCLRNRGHRVVN